jgi:hypothetical protein
MKVSLPHCRFDQPTICSSHRSPPVSARLSHRLAYSSTISSIESSYEISSKKLTASIMAEDAKDEVNDAHHREIDRKNRRIVRRANYIKSKIIEEMHSQHDHVDQVLMAMTHRPKTAPDLIRRSSSITLERYLEQYEPPYHDNKPAIPSRSTTPIFDMKTKIMSTVYREHQALNRPRNSAPCHRKQQPGQPAWRDSTSGEGKVLDKIFGDQTIHARTLPPAPIAQNIGSVSTSHRPSTAPSSTNSPDRILHPKSNRPSTSHAAHRLLGQQRPESDTTSLPPVQKELPIVSTILSPANHAIEAGRTRWQLLLEELHYVSDVLHINDLQELASLRNPSASIAAIVGYIG